MSIVAKTPSGYKKIGSAYLGEQPVDKVFNANGDVVYALQRELTGVPPLLFKGKEQSELLNYRIYGDTVGGESVGDRTGNLFGGEFLQGYWAYSDGTRNNTSATWITTSKLPCKPNTDYSFKSSYIGRYFGFVWFDSNGEYISSSYVSDTSSNMYVNFSSLSPVDAAYLIINIKSHYNTSTGDSFAITPSDVTDLMLNEGSAPLPYEPYGYKVPVTVEGKNLCNNSWEQKMISADTGVANSNASTVCCDFIPVKPNVTYSCSRTIGNNYNNLRCYGASKNYLGIGADLANKGNPLGQRELFGTFMITDARVSYIRFNDTSNSLDTKYMLVEGAYTAETMPSYEPYHAPVTTPIYLPEQIKMVGDEAEYIDYGEQKQHRVRKNLLQNTVTSQTINGVTYTVNSDGSVTCNGTATERIGLRINTTMLRSGDYICSNNIQGSSTSYYVDWSIRAASSTTLKEYSQAIKITTDESVNVSAWINITSGYTCDNLTFYPMIRKADITDDAYEPYIENTDVDVTLPALPTIKGTNTMSVDTEVQPSRMDIKGRIKSLT